MCAISSSSPYGHQHEVKAVTSPLLQVGKGRAGLVICCAHLPVGGGGRMGSGLPGLGSWLFLSLSCWGWVGDSFVCSHPHIGLLDTLPARGLGCNRSMVRGRGVSCQGSPGSGARLHIRCCLHLCLDSFSLSFLSL